MVFKRRWIDRTTWDGNILSFSPQGHAAIASLVSQVLVVAALPDSKRISRSEYTRLIARRWIWIYEASVPRWGHIFAVSKDITGEIERFYYLDAEGLIYVHQEWGPKKLSESRDASENLIRKYQTMEGILFIQG